MAAGDQILATGTVPAIFGSRAGELTKIIVNGGKIWVEGFPFAETERRLADQALKTAARSGLGPWGWVIGLMVIALAAFRAAATQGCDAKYVNRLMVELGGAILTGNVLSGNSIVMTLFQCLLNGLSVIPVGTLAFVKNNAMEFRDPDGNILATYQVATGTYIFGAQTTDSGILGLDCFVTGTSHVATRVADTHLDIVASGLLDTASQPPFNSLARSQSAFHIARRVFLNPTYESSIHEVSSSGALGPVITLAGDTLVRVFGVAWGGTTVYYTTDTAGTVYQHGSGVFALGDAGFSAYAILGLNNGGVVVLWHKGTLPVGSSAGINQVCVYTAGGTLVSTFGPFPAPSYMASLLTRGVDDTSVWIWLGTQVSEVRVSDGRVLHAFNTYGLPGETLNGLFVVRTAISPTLL